jgi:hypothetical protein
MGIFTTFGKENAKLFINTFLSLFIDSRLVAAPKNL